MCDGDRVIPETLQLDAGPDRLASDWVQHLPLGRPLRELETQFIISTLEYHDGNRTHAAKTLGISLRTLRNKINEYTAEGIEVIQPAGARL